MNVDEFKYKMKDKKSDQANELPSQGRWMDLKIASVLLEQLCSVLAN